MRASSGCASLVAGLARSRINSASNSAMRALKLALCRSLAVSGAGDDFVAGSAGFVAAGFVARPARRRRERSVEVMATLPIGGRPMGDVLISLLQRYATKIVSLQAKSHSPALARAGA